ncbi:TPA: hypothetical protein ACGPMP_004380 [Enterobacter roggenkampii]|uniref:hypothetical protein n=1 Tax=Enterobacter roggenkampii TaxID=1812935 RepID=UPI0035D45EEA
MGFIFIIACVGVGIAYWFSLLSVTACLFILLIVGVQVIIESTVSSDSQYVALRELIREHQGYTLRNQEIINSMSNELSEAKRKIERLESILDSDC